MNLCESHCDHLQCAASISQVFFMSQNSATPAKNPEIPAQFCNCRRTRLLVQAAGKGSFCPRCGHLFHTNGSLPGSTTISVGENSTPAPTPALPPPHLPYPHYTCPILITPALSPSPPPQPHHTLSPSPIPYPHHPCPIPITPARSTPRLPYAHRPCPIPTTLAIYTSPLP